MIVWAYIPINIVLIFPASPSSTKFSRVAHVKTNYITAEGRAPDHRPTLFEVAVVYMKMEAP